MLNKELLLEQKLDKDILLKITTSSPAFANAIEHRIAKSPGQYRSGLFYFL